jgi:hypothetical protein
MDTNLTHIAAAGVVKALAVSASLAANVAAGAGPVVDLKGMIGTAIVIADFGVETAGSGETLNAALYESDDLETWTAVPNGAFAQVTTAASLQTLSFRPGERKRYLSLASVLGGSGVYPFSAHVLMLPGQGS